MVASLGFANRLPEWRTDAKEQRTSLVVLSRNRDLLLSFCSPGNLFIGNGRNGNRHRDDRRPS
jgi:hypothetical protein